MHTRLTAVVAGGGIGGLAAATALARCGIAVTVIERASTFTGGGSGLVLYPNGVAAADTISSQLGQRIRSAGHIAEPGETRLLISASGRVLAREPVGLAGRRYGTPQVSILRTTLLQALADEAAAAGVRLRPGLAVRGYVTSDESVSVQLSDGTTHHAGLLVAADGIRSAMRERMLGDGPPRYLGYTSVRGWTSGSWLGGQGSGPQGFVASGRGVQLFAAPVAGDTLYWTAKITAPPDVWPKREPVAALKALAALLADWHEPIVRLITEASPGDVAVTDIHDRDPAPRWTDGRVVLLGDAAHPMTPALGQAANMALEDAVVLAAALRSHLGQSGDHKGGDASVDACSGAVSGIVSGAVSRALRSYEQQRTARTARVVLLSRRQGTLDQGTGRLRSLVRDGAMRLRGRKDTAISTVVAWKPPQAAHS